MKKLFTLMLCISLLLGSTAVSAATIYLVDNSSKSGQTGTGWRTAGTGEQNVHLDGTAFNVWYAGITFVQNDQVWLLSDVNKYILTDVITLKSYGKLIGGFYGTETLGGIGGAGGRQLNTNPAGDWDLKYPTILDGNNLVSGIKGGTATVYIDGFTIQNCVYTGSTASTSAGVTINYGGTTLKNSIVTACTNSGTASGGTSSAVFLARGCKMISCYVHHNTYSGTGAYGGAAVSVSGSAEYATTQTDAISSCKITDNLNTTSNYGGGIFLYSPIADGLKNLGIKNSTISNNTSFGLGGGIYVYYYGNFNNTANNTPILISGCTIDGNKANAAGNYGGAALYLNNYTVTNTNNNLTIQNSVITNNRAETSASPAVATQGSAFYSNTNITINNCVVASNYGANVFYLGSGADVSATVNNCTFANNVNATGPCQVLYCSAPVTASTFTNSIFYNQTSGPINTGTGIKPNVTYCGFESTVSSSAPYNGTGNIKSISASSFVNPTSDYHLSAGSPAINVGTTIAAISTDLEGGVRPSGIAYDLGAYEYGASKATGISAPIQDLIGFSVTNNSIISKLAGFVQIYSISGALVQSKQVTEGELISLSKGLYILKLTSSISGTLIQKIAL